MRFHLPALPGQPTTRANLRAERGDVFAEGHAGASSAGAQKMAPTAVTRCRSAGQNVGVLGGVFVALRTLGLRALASRSLAAIEWASQFASAQIHTASDWLQVGWIHAMPDPAQVVEVKRFIESACQQPVCKSMRDLFTLAVPKLPVAAGCLTARPQPARVCLFNHLEEALGGVSGLWAGAGHGKNDIRAIGGVRA